MSRSRPPGNDPLDRVVTTFPGRIPAMPVRSSVIFPTGATALQVGFAPRSIRLSSAAATDIRSYLDFVLGLAWNLTRVSGPIDLASVSTALDAEHFGWAGVKRRILEILSVAILRDGVPGLIPCIVGPPGVGTCSLAPAVAWGMDRPLARVDLRNPVFVVEEMGEVGLGKVEGDPVEALEEFDTALLSRMVACQRPRQSRRTSACRGGHRGRRVAVDQGRERDSPAGPADDGE